jgi:hypothetical protein
MNKLSKDQKDEFATAFAILALYDGGVSPRDGRCWELSFEPHRADLVDGWHNENQSKVPSFGEVETSRSLDEMAVWQVQNSRVGVGNQATLY